MDDAKAVGSTALEWKHGGEEKFGHQKSREHAEEESKHCSSEAHHDLKNPTVDPRECSEPFLKN